MTGSDRDQVADELEDQAEDRDAVEQLQLVHHEIAPPLP